jgi:hypothetical protein
MRVLGLGDVSQRQTYFPDDTEYVNETPFEAALLASVLQTLPRNQVQKALQSLYDELPDGGRLIVTVPSLEFACREVVTKNDISLAAYLSLYGMENEPHLSGFTLLWLRRCLEEVGFIVVQARTEHFKMSFKSGELLVEEPAVQNIVIGVKRQVDAEKQIDWIEDAVPSD